MNDHRVSDRAVGFDETKLSERVNPLAPPAPDFDWDGLAAALGEVVPESDQQRLAHAIGCLLSFVAGPWSACLRPGAKLSPRRAELSVSRMALVLCWMVRPDEFAGLTLEALADRLGCNERHLRKLVARIREKFGTIRSLK